MVKLNQREGQRGNSSQSWVENTNMTGCISSLKTVPLWVTFIDQRGNILLQCISSLLVHMFPPFCSAIFKRICTKPLCILRFQEQRIRLYSIIGTDLLSEVLAAREGCRSTAISSRKSYNSSSPNSSGNSRFRRSLICFFQVKRLATSSC